MYPCKDYSADAFVPTWWVCAGHLAKFQKLPSIQSVLGLARPTLSFEPKSNLKATNTNEYEMNWIIDYLEINWFFFFPESFHNLIVPPLQQFWVSNLIMTQESEDKN